METNRPDVWMISWKEAIQREHEYQKKVKMHQQHIDNSGPLTAVPQESPLQAGVVEGTDSLHANLQTDDAQRSTEMLKCHVSLQQISATQRPPLNQWPSYPSLQNRLHKKGYLQQPQSQHNCQPFWNKGSMPTEKPGQQTSMFQQYRCHFCTVNCSSELNFLLHLHGQKHKLNMQNSNPAKSRLLEKGVSWCDECNIPCVDMRSLAQHRQGKKHQARMEMLAKCKGSCARAAFAISNT